MAKLTKFKKKQDAKERNQAATGGISAITTGAEFKPLSLSKYRSFTARQRADAKAAARKAADNGTITKAQAQAIIKRIDEANAKEVDTAVVKMQQGAADKKAPPVSLGKELPPSRLSGNGPPPEKNPRDMTKAELARKLREQEAKAKPRPMKKGGMAKRKNYKDGGYANCGASMKPTQGKK